MQNKTLIEKLHYINQEIYAFYPKNDISHLKNIILEIVPTFFIKYDISDDTDGKTGPGFFTPFQENTSFTKTVTRTIKTRNTYREYNNNTKPIDEVYNVTFTTQLTFDDALQKLVLLFCGIFLPIIACVFCIAAHVEDYKHKIEKEENQFKKFYHIVNAINIPWLLIKLTITILLVAPFAAISAILLLRETIALFTRGAATGFLDISKNDTCSPTA